MILKREKDELSVVNQSLDNRLSEALMRADQIPTLEMDKKRLIEKEKVYNQQIEQAKKELEAMRDKEKELQAKVDDLENTAIAAGTPSNKHGFKKMLPTVATPSNQSN